MKKAQTIPWNAIERRYARLFTNNKGNMAKPLRLGLGACIIQAEYGFSDAELTRTIQEQPYFQCFCGYKAYGDSKPPFDPSLMVYCFFLAKTPPADWQEAFQYCEWYPHCLPVHTRL